MPAPSNTIRLLALCCLSLVACDSESPTPTKTAAPQNAKPAKAESTPEVTAQSKKAVSKPVVEPKVEGLVVDAKASSRALQKGRSLAKSGDDEGTLRAFEVTVRKDPTSGSAQCEAGWAAFNVKRPVQARNHLARGIAVADAKTKPACLYNLGREVSLPVLGLLLGQAGAVVSRWCARLDLHRASLGPPSLRRPQIPSSESQRALPSRGARSRGLPSGSRRDEHVRRHGPSPASTRYSHRRIAATAGRRR